MKWGVTTVRLPHLTDVAQVVTIICMYKSAHQDKFAT